MYVYIHVGVDVLWQLCGGQDNFQESVLFQAPCGPGDQTQLIRVDIRNLFYTESKFLPTHVAQIP